MATVPQRKMSAAERVKAALAVLSEGGSYDDAARAGGYSCAKSCWRAVRDALRRLPAPEIEEYRAIETEHLMMLRREAIRILRSVHWATCSKGLVTTDDGLPVVDNAPRLAAIRELRQISESFRRLHGIDQPVRLSIDSADEDDALLAELDAFIEDSLRTRDVPIPDGMVVVERDATGYPTKLAPADEVIGG